MFVNNNNNMARIRKTPKSKITVNDQKAVVFGELESIKSKLKKQTYEALQRKVNKSKKRGLTLLSKDFKTIFDTDQDTKKLTLTKLKQQIREIKEIGTRRVRFDEQFKQFHDDNKKIEFDKIKPKDLEYILNKLKGVRGKIMLEISGKFYTVDANKINDMLKHLKDYYVKGEESQGSDPESLISQILTELNVSISRVKSNGKSSNNGGFFKYYNKTNIDLTEFGIYSKSPDRYSENCLIQSFVSSGLDHAIISSIRCMVVPTDTAQSSFKYVPTNKLTTICEKFKLFITVKKICKGGMPNNNYPSKYKKCPAGYTQIDLGLIDNHYFYIKKVPINQYALENYFDLCDTPGFETIKSANGRKEKRYTTSFKAISFMFENKEKYLTEIPYEDLLNTQYHDLAKTITSLEYDENCVKINETKMNKMKDDVVNVFFDFETITTSKHIPYMCSIYDDGTIKTFHGERSGKLVLDHLFYKYYLDNPNVTIKLIAHNAGYDYAFIQKFLTITNIIQRGHNVMNATGKYWGRRGNCMNVIIQDSYSIITMPLSGFPKAFGLVGKKEVIPYKLYTKENVEKKYLQVADLMPYCIQQVKENNIGKVITDKDYDTFYGEMIDNAREWKCLSHDETGINIIRYSKLYCERDVEILKQGYDMFGGYLNELGCDIDNYISAAQFANDYMIKQGVFDDVYKISSVPREFIMKSMVGGRVMCAENEKQDITGSIDDFDAVSLYPSAMKKLGGYLKGVPHVLEDDQKNMSFLNSCDGYFLKIWINKVGIRRKFPCISYINRDGIRTWTNDPEDFVYVGKIGLEDLIRFQQIEFNIIEGYYYCDGRNNILGDVIGNLFEKRKEQKQKKNKIEQVYKLIMNSAYGKTLLKPFDDEIKFMNGNKLDDYVDKNYNMMKYYEPIETCNEKSKRYKIVMEKSINNHYNNAHAGCEVLEMSKRIMNEVMCLAEDLELGIYYQDTDSIHIKTDAIETLADEYTKKYNRDLIGAGMGQFHTDFDSNKIVGDIHARRHIALGKKCYIDELVGKDTNGNEVVDYHIRMKGVPNKSILYKAQTERRDVMEIYESMLKGKQETFDLNCGGYKINFKHNGDYSITTNNEKFERALCF